MVAPKKVRDVLIELINTYRENYRQAIIAELPDMTFRQFVYLDAIVRMDNPTYGEVAMRFKVSKPAVTAIVKRLIGLGYLERVQSLQDHRVHHLAARPKARAIMVIEKRTALGWVTAMKNCLTPQEQEQFFALAEKIVAGKRRG